MIERQPNTEYILSLSYGKDSLACLFAIEQLGWPLDRIVHAEVWATDTIPADLPPMVEFKTKADAIIKERWGIEVEHVCAMRDAKKLTYEDLFYHVPVRKCQKSGGGYLGFPMVRGAWCNSRLKIPALRMASSNRKLVQKTQATLYTDGRTKSEAGASGSSTTIFSALRRGRGAEINTVQYLGIAADELERILRHTKPGYRLPLVAAGWDEKYCRQLCEENDLLSPIYTTATRGGCWFCHNQGVDQLRLLRKTYPEYWALMLKWDSDSPVTFKADGHTVHDYDARFAAEDAGLVPADRNFRWEMIGRKIIKPRVELPGQITMEELINAGIGSL